MFRELSIADMHSKYLTGDLKPHDVAMECISKYDHLESTYHAWVCFDREKLLHQANACRDRLARGEAIRPLEGIPVAVKDIINTVDFPTQMGSQLWKDFTPGNDARIIYYVKNAGGLVPGKAVTAEFAVHTLNETLNPHDPTRTPGTSSSGSAVAIALGMVPVALGTQTAGSIVRPASFCGVYGCKPSFGLIPRTGMLKTTDSLDTVGFFTAQRCDIQRVFEVLRVHGPNFPISNRALTDEDRQNCQKGKPWRVALVHTHTWEYATDYARQSLVAWAEQLANDRNVIVTEVSLPDALADAHAIHETIYNKTLSYYFSEEYRKAELVSPIMNELISQGNQIPVTVYHQALTEQTELIHVMDNFFTEYDILVSLSTAGEAPLRHVPEAPDPALMWTMTHLPVVSAPCFTSPTGLPFGLQLAARKFNDYLLFRFTEYLGSVGLLPNSATPINKDN